MSLSPDFFLWGVKLPLNWVSGRLEEFLVGQGKVTLHPGEGLHVGRLKIQTVLQCTVPCVHCIPMIAQIFQALIFEQISTDPDQKNLHSPFHIDFVWHSCTSVHPPNPQWQCSLSAYTEKYVK